MLTQVPHNAFSTPLREWAIHLHVPNTKEKTTAEDPTACRQSDGIHFPSLLTTSQCHETHEKWNHLRVNLFPNILPGIETRTLEMGGRHLRVEPKTDSRLWEPSFASQTITNARSCKKICIKVILSNFKIRFYLLHGLPLF